VFVVAYLGDWRPAAAVLFEPASLRGDPAPRRETGERVAPTIAARTRGGGGLGTDFDCDGGLIAGTLNASGKAAGSATQQDAESGLLVAGTLGANHGNIKAEHAWTGQLLPTAFGGNNPAGPIDVATALNASHTASGRQDFEAETFIATTLRARDGAEGFDASEDGTGRGVPLVASTMTSNGDAHSGYKDELGLVAVAFNPDQSERTRSMGERVEQCPTLRADGPVAASVGAAVRRLTPRECERLQGFPDDFTLVPYRKAMAADGPRYRALGNSMAVPVMSWIGRRIAKVSA
jgi:DNA (cytosine-5)-methyltransferase 1